MPVLKKEVAEMIKEVAEMIIETLDLEGVSVDSIEPDAPLFNEGLGLDSIDALELSLAITQKYGFQLKADDAQNKQVFSSLSALSEFIKSNRKS